MGPFELFRGRSHEPLKICSGDRRSGNRSGKRNEKAKSKFKVEERAPDQGA